jgi:hypothetical protein
VQNFSSDVQYFFSNRFGQSDASRLLLAFSTAATFSSTTQVPAGRKQGLACAGRGLQHRLYAGDDGDCGCGRGRLALGCDNDDHVAFLQVF